MSDPTARHAPAATTPTPGDTPRGLRSRRLRRRSLVGALFVLLLIAAYTASLNSFFSDAQHRDDATVVSDGAGPDHVTVSGTLVQVDPLKGEATVRLLFTPEGKYATEDGSLAQNMVLTVDNATGVSDRPFEKGKSMSPTDVVISMTDGAVTSYPFDKTNANIGFYLATQGVTAAAATQDKPAVEAVESVPVDVNFDLQAAVHGFSIATAADPASAGPYAAIDLTIQRSKSTLFFSLFVMLLMWILALGAIGIAWRVIVMGTKAELAMCTMLSALLFAFPAVRNLQPSAPPIGALSDFLAFFWCESLVAVSLFLVLGNYVFRSLRAQRVVAA